MEFLKEQFESELIAEVDDKGQVLIGGAEFTPTEILQELDDQSYLSCFDDWLVDQKQKRGSKADEILNQYGNRDRFNRLKEAFDRSAVVPFVGAGLSQASGYPGWTSFLEKLRGETRITLAQLKAMLDGGLYEEAAQALADDMPAGSFNEELENVYCAEREMKGPVQFLPHVFKGPVITTNFDNILKQCFDRASPFSETLIGGDSAEIKRYLGRNEHVLVKLHGKANSGKNRILTKREYDSYYDKNNSLPDAIKNIASNQLLFIGCSLGVDRTIKVLIEIAQTQGHDNAVRHYAFLPLFDEAERLDRRDALAEANIFPIWYPVEVIDGQVVNEEIHDESIAALLEALGIEE
jgi:hypothetical protein